MQDQIIKDIPLFVEAANSKNFSAAAESLDIPVSTLSRRIARLEKDLGVTLFRRNSRTVHLTEAGSVFFDHCKSIVTDVAEAKEALLSSVHTPAGMVRVSAPSDFGRFMGPTLVGFAKKYPKIKLDILEKEYWSDLMVDSIDLEIRVGDLPDSSLVARKLLDVKIGVYAAPSLLEGYPPISTPADLKNLPCLCLRSDLHWSLSKGDKKVEITVRPTHLFSSHSTLIPFAIGGAGITAMGQDLAALHVRSGDLVRVLPEWAFPARSIYIVTSSKKPPRRVSLFMDYLLEQVKLRMQKGIPLSQYFHLGSQEFQKKEQ